MTVVTGRGEGAGRPCFVGFDTSNYTTSAAIVTYDGEVIANLKRPLPVGEGKRGIRQSDAVFEHTRNLPYLTDEIKKILSETGYTPVAAGASVTPRDAEGSYMPCFLVGKAAANAFASALGVPVYEFSHQSGHIMAAIYSSGKRELLEDSPFAAFHVSGGTTEALYVESDGIGLRVTLVGETEDINAGQLIDRVGVAMGLSFPCGVEMERLASDYTGKIYAPRICVRDGKCSLSGAENIAMRIYGDRGDRSETAAFVFDFIGRTLYAMAEDVRRTYDPKHFLFAGGVMSNQIMRKRLSEGFSAYYAEPSFSADNAAGVALLCRRAYLGDK